MVTDGPAAHPGVYVGVLGLDGAGKTTVARGLTAALAAQGYASEFIRWRDLAARAGREDFPHPTLRQLLVETWRSRFGGGTDPQSRRVQHGPVAYEDFVLADLEPGPPYPVGVHRSGVLTSAMLEFVADMLIQAEFINGRVAAGRIVVTESYGYKNVMKVLRVAREIPSDDVPRSLISTVHDFIARAYSDPFMQPDVGIFLNVSAEECYRRIAMRGSVGPAEDFGFAGRSGRSSFIELQSALLAEYAEMAHRWGWHVIDVDDSASAAEVLDAVNQLVVADVLSAVAPG